MKLETKRGQEFEIAESTWNKCVAKYGDRAREEALTWLCRRAEHAKYREAGCPEPDPGWLVERTELRRLCSALDNDFAAGTCGYDPIDLIDRTVNNRPKSAGQVRAISRLLENVETEPFELQARREWIEEWEFETRQLAELDAIV